MPRTRSLAWAQLKIGIVAVVAIALAIIFIIAVGGQGGFSWQRYELKTKFANVQGLKSGAIVRVAGVEVGKVTNIEFVGAEVQVAVEVNEEQQSRITDQSRASIGSLSLLGEPTIEISPASAGTPLKDGDFIQSERSAGQFSAAAENATQTLEQTTALIKELRAGRGTMGKLFTDDQLYREMNELIASAEAVTTAINGGRGTLGKLVNDPAMYQQANVAVANLQEITRRINAGEGSIGRLLHDDQMAKSLSSASANVDQVTGKLSRGEGTAGKLLTDQQLYDRFNSVAARIDKLAADLEQGRGAAGQFLQDKQLYENMNGAANELRGLIGDIRKDPKKYLNVRVSIF
ncbi:MAG TPA: MlaD family protein [Vicinamibacterales bacterium]|jgi:phospholipid/cholesterol/gamma-HCH transport system substrate-binding protein|nr:MlaD family protein [Vicinamibacterales bacterium]